MNKNIILAVAAILIVIGIGAALKFTGTGSSGSSTSTRTCTVKGNVYNASDNQNPASMITGKEVRLTCESFNSEIENYKGVALVDIYLPGCIHCQKMGPILGEISKETFGKYKIAKIDASKYTDIAGEFKVASVPDMLIFKNGKKVDEIVGEASKQEVLDKLKAVAGK
jgi:thioredoxin-like negative regulator of GroEL